MQHYPRTVAALAAASLLAAFGAQANKGAEYHPEHHKEHHKNFFITGGATYLEPSFNGLDYAQIVTHPAAGGIYYDSTEAVEPEFNWGYFIQAGYRISHHYDVQASWSMYNSNLEDSTAVTAVAGTNSYLITSNNVYVGNDNIPTGDTATAHSKQNLQYSMFDANLGQYHDITEMLRARIFAGIAYAKVDSDIDNVYSVTGLATPYIDNFDSSFSGVGPEVGMDLEYKIWHTIGVVSHFSAAFLIGNMDTDSYVYNTYHGEQVSVETDSATQMVPMLNAKLGLNWNVPYAYEKVSFGIEAGYEVAYLWNVIDEVQYIYTTENTAVHNQENYGNMGPYLNFTAMF